MMHFLVHRLIFSLMRVPDIENVMNTVFGSKRSRKEAELWKQYWNELNMYEEALRLENIIGDVPMVCAWLWII